MSGRVSVTVIGEADGPTSVWIAGKTKEKNIFRRLRREIWQKKARRRSALVQEKLKKRMDSPDMEAHTLKEVCAYLIEKYGEVELSRDSEEYQLHFKDCKGMLVEKYQPELLGEPLSKLRPASFEDGEAVEKYMKKVDEYYRRARELPEECFPMDYHCFGIALPKDGRVWVEIELLHDTLLCACSGPKKTKKQGERVMQDIWRYYGLTRMDLEEKTERYHSYLAMMTM